MPRTSSPLFSIIVPAYNVEQYISECIESVLAQSFQNFELILVDDGSTDRTGEICDEYQKSRGERNKNQPHDSIVSQNGEKVNSKPVKVIHQPNSGLSAARNTGVKTASGEYLIFLDGDDYLEVNALANICRGLDLHQGTITNEERQAHSDVPPVQENLDISSGLIDLLRFQAQEVFSDGKTIKYPELGFATTSGVVAFRKLEHYHYIENAWLYCYRREFFVGNHFAYAKGCVAEDFGLTPLVIAKADRVKSIPDICYNYRQRSGSITRGAASILRRTSDIDQQLKHIIPEIVKIPHAAPVLHFLVASFLTSATTLSYTEFLQFYHVAKQSGWLKYIRPGSFKAVPRAFFLRYFPKTFYRLYRRDKTPQVDANRS